jgi:hypothetical protein
VRDYFDDVERKVLFWRDQFFDDFNDDELYDFLTGAVVFGMSIRLFRVFIRLMTCQTYDDVKDYISSVEGRDVSMDAIERRAERAKNEFFMYMVKYGENGSFKKRMASEYS